MPKGFDIKAWSPLLWVFPMLLGTYLLGYQVEQQAFYWIVGAYSAMFLAYGGLLFGANKRPLWGYLLLAFLLRFLLLFDVPHLSDDVYRFIWDGRLLLHGFNPFDHLPGYYLQQPLVIPGINQALFEQLNSPGYFTIYPPIAQASFAVACWISPTSIWGSSLVLKSFLLLFEMGNAWLLVKLLAHYGRPLHRSLLYLLNPLIIIELSGNLHYESGMIFFLLLSWWLTVRAKGVVLSGLAYGASVATKLLPLMFLPYYLRRMGWRQSFLFFVSIGVGTLLLFSPLLNDVFLKNIGSSLDLYFRKFEFNASIYYVLRWLGIQWTGYNQIQWIGPGLALCTVLFIGWTAFSEKTPIWEQLPLRALGAITMYLFCTTTVHPWYLALPIVFCLFTDFRFPILWSYLITWTYINYSYSSYHENLWVVFLEYSLVISFLVWEWRRQKAVISTPLPAD